MEWIRARPSRPGRGAPGERVVVLGGDRVAEGEAAGAEHPHVEGDASRHEAVQGRAAQQVLPGDPDLALHQRAHLRRGDQLPQVVLGDAEPVHRLAGQVDAVPVGEVARDVLPEVDELQADAGGVAHADPPRVAVAEHAEHHLADGGGRMTAVVNQLLVGVPARAALVHPVRLDQAQERIGGELAAGDQPGDGGEAGPGPRALERGAQVVLPRVEVGEPLGRPAGPLVADVVGRAAEWFLTTRATKMSEGSKAQHAPAFRGAGFSIPRAGARSEDHRP